MKNKCLVLFICLSFSTSSYANLLAAIVDRIEKTNIINANILNIQDGMLNVQRDILTSQKDIESLMKQVNSNITGNSGWGTYNFHDYGSYGNEAANWSSVLKTIQSGGGSGPLAQTIKSLSNQFPINHTIFNQGIKNTDSQKYYLAQSETVLAARAASQLDYDKVQDQIFYQQMLQNQIEKTNNLKAAVDLNNRIQVESNLINLEILRQTALSNQQQAIIQQGGLISDLSNAKFLTKE